MNKLNFKDGVNVLTSGLLGSLIDMQRQKESFQEVQYRANSDVEYNNSMSTTLIVVIVVVLILVVALLVLLCMSTYRLVPNNKILHTVLTALFGSLYVSILWIMYGIFFNYKLIKSTKSIKSTK